MGHERRVGRDGTGAARACNGWRGAIQHAASRPRRGIDTLYGFLVTAEGTFYDGAAYEPNLAHATICGERHAIANMVMNEGYGSKIASIVIADPMPSEQERGTPPCETCRHLIWQFGTPETSVILVQYIQHRGTDGVLSGPSLALRSIWCGTCTPIPTNRDLWKS